MLALVLVLTLTLAPMVVAAPAWQVTEWRNLAEGQASLEVDDLAGRVVLLWLFAPGQAVARAEGSIAFARLAGQLADHDDVAFVAIQASAEPSDEDAEWFSRAVAEFASTQPVGRAGEEGSALLTRYGVDAAPLFVLIDAAGKVDCSQRRIDSDDLHARILELGAGRKLRSVVMDGIATLPRSRGGQDVVGKVFPTLLLDRWVRGSAESPAGVRATLYRWWTDACPYCEASLPALEELRSRHGASGLRVVGVYHPKPPREVDDQAILARASAIGFAGPLAADLDWSELDRVYDLAGGRRHATSVSFLVDSDNRIRFCHPGPELHPSEDPDHARCDADFTLLEQAVQHLLAKDSR